MAAATRNDARVMTLEDMVRITWMAICACVVLFVASLPGGLVTVTGMLVGVFLGVSGLSLHRRLTRGPEAVPPALDPIKDRLRQHAQSRVLYREFGRSAALPAPGRRVDVVEILALRSWRFTTPEGQLRAVLFDAGEDGLVLVTGALLRVEVSDGRSLHRRIRLEMLPRTRGILSLTSYGGSLSSEEIDCNVQIQAWLGGCNDFSCLELDELPWDVSERIAPSSVPYRQ